MVLNYCGYDTTAALAEYTDIESVESSLKVRARNSWKLESHGKSKLHTFIQVHNFEELKTLLKANLERPQTSLVAQLKSGILPIRLETGHYKSMNIADRVCQVCNTGVTEDEIHFLFNCKKLADIRKPYIDKMVPEDTKLEKTDKVALFRTCILPENLKEFADWLNDMYHARKRILSK